MLNRRRLLAAFLAMAAAGTAMALDPHTPMMQYGHRRWQKDDGLPQSTLQAIAQTPDGYIWVGTQGGLARFDGIRFTTFDLPENMVKGAYVFSLAVDRKGTLWIGSSGPNPLFTYRDGIFTPIAGLRWFGVREIYSIAAASDGSIWMGTGAGVLRRAPDGAIKLWTRNDGLPTSAVRKIFIDRHDRVFAGTERGLAMIDHGRVTPVGTQFGLPPRAVRSIYEDSRGRLWIGTNEGVFCVSGGAIVNHPELRDIATAFVSAILEDANHNVWFGTNAGLERLNADGTSSAVEAEQLTSRFVLSLFEARDHTLWAGTFAGLEQFRDTAFRIWGRDQGFRDEGVFAVTQGRHGSIWLGTFGGLGRIEPDGKLQWFGRGEGLSNETIIALAPARDGGVWAGTYGGGVCRVGAGPTRCWGTGEGLSHGVVTSIVEDDDGSIWLGTVGGGLDHFRDGKVVGVYGEREGLMPRVTTLTPARGGGIWVGMIGGPGAVLFRNGRIERVIRLSNSPVDVRAIHEENDGGLWIGSTQLSLSYAKDGRVTQFPLSQDLDEPGVHSIIEHDGFLWLTTRPAVFRISKAELLRYVRGETKTVHPTRFGPGEGLTIPEFGTGQPSSIVAKDGTLWFNGKRGAAELPPGALQRHKIPEPVVGIESAIAGERRLAGSSPIIDSRGVRVTFRYTAIDFLAPDQLRFRYKLDGYDADWLDAGTARTADYTNLPPGDYAFRVMAARGEGSFNESGTAAMRFTRKPEFRETWTFYIACAFLLALLAGLIFRARLRLLRRHERDLEARIDDSTRQLRLAKEAAERAAERSAELAHKEQMILGSAGEGIFGLDAQGVATFVNPSAARMLGSAVDEMIGRKLHDVIHAPREGGPLPPNDDCPVCSAVLDPPVRVSKTDTFNQRSGKTIPVEYTASTIVSEQGAPTGVVVTFRDISERLVVDRLKSEFVSTVSHELRTPLTSIRGALGLLAGGLIESPNNRVQRMLDIAVNNTDRLVRLINDILDVERIDSGKAELNCKLVDAGDLMQQTAEGMTTVADRAGVTVVVEPVRATLWADADRITQLLTNLVSNAIKFSPRASTVTLDAVDDGRTFTFRVTDRGRGIPEEKLEMIFERFKQVDASDSRDKGGTGLGLAICRSIATAHGGRIWAESRPGLATVFQFAIPRDPACAAPPAVAETKCDDCRTILICEEDRQAMAGLLEIVEMHGHRVTAVSSADLVARAAADRPDAIVLDLATPGANSSMLEALQNNERTRDIPVVVATMKPPRSIEQHANRIAAWVRKPFKETEVVEALTVACRKPLILVVEDDADLARVMTTAIQAHGIRTIHAADGRAAIEECRHALPDLVVLDVILPEMDGFHVVEWLKQNTALHSVPLIVYSALELGAAQQKRLRLGPTAFLTKSRASIDEFDRHVMRLLNTVTMQEKEISGAA